MTIQQNDTFRILIPPEFEYLPSLFLPDLGRAGWVARISLVLSQLRGQGHAVTFDTGSRGLTAAETAEQLNAEGVCQAFLVGMPDDEKSLDILSRALTDAKIIHTPALLLPNDADSRLINLRDAVRERTKSLTTTEQGKVLISGTNHPFMLLETGDPASLTEPFFYRKEDLLVRSGVGDAGSIPAWVEKIRIIHAGETFDELSEKTGESILYVCALPDDPAEAGITMDLCARIAHSAGPERIRFLSRPRGARCGGAEWAARYGLDTPYLRDFIDRLITRLFPHLRVYWNAVKLFYQLGEDPLEEMYAGNSLPDRNAELIENIVP